MTDVVSVVSDGLGNQLFQLAATYTALEDVAGRTHQILVVDDRPGTPALQRMTGVEVRRPNRRDRFRWRTVSSLPGPLSPVSAAAAARRARRDRRVVIRPESPFSPAPVLQPGQRVEMRGHFQNISWFDRTWSLVADLLLDRAPTWFSERVAEQRTVVHVRRGDYVHHGWQLPADYYRRALESLGGGVDGVGEVVVVTDEPDFLPWIEAVLKPLGCSVSSGSDRHMDGGLADFWTMAAAARLVMSNSTFAWWAGACATRRQSSTTVVCPDPRLLWPHLPAPVPAFPLAGWRMLPSGFGS